MSVAAFLPAGKAMAREKERRYSSAEVFAEDLARFLRGEPIQARPPSVGYRLRRRLARGKLVLVAAVGLASVGGILLAGIPKLRLAREQTRREQAAAERERAQAERYRWLQEEKIKPLMRKIEDARPFFYIEDLAVFRAKMEEVGKALEELEDLASDPMNAGCPDVWVLLGMGWYFVGDRVRAERALLTAERLAPGDGQVAFYLARIHTERAFAEITEGGEHLQQARQRRAQDLMKSVLLPWRGREMDRQLAMAYQALVESRWDEVRRLAREGLDRFPAELGREEYWLLLGCVEDGDSAIASLTRAMEIRPQYAWGYILRGAKRCEAGDYQGGIDDATRAVEIHPRSVAAYHNRGVARFHNGDAAGAMEDFTRGIDLDPERAGGYFNRAIARQWQSDLDGAISDYGEVLRLDPRFAAACNNRGNLRRIRGDIDGALADLDEAIRIDPQYAAAHNNRAIVRGDRGNLEGARTDYTRVIELDPRNARAYYERGRVNDRRRDRPGALADFTMAIGLDRRHAEVYNDRGSVRYDLWDFAGAIADFTAVLRLQSRNATAWFNRGLARSRLGQSAAALADVAHAVQIAPVDWPLRAQARRALDELNGLR